MKIVIYVATVGAIINVDSIDKKYGIIIELVNK